jgi:single-strand DNA-binding protein
MRSINKVILVGNLTRDPEMRQTPSGQAVCTFSIATNREWITKEGKKHSLTEYHDLVAWAKLAEICQMHLKKGKLIYVEGYLKTRSWDTPEGIKKFKTEIIIQDMIMLDKRENKDNGMPDYIPEENGVNNHQPEPEDLPAEVPAEAKEASKEENKKANALDIDADLGL